MVGVRYEHSALIDTSAVLALFDPHDRFHEDANLFFGDATGVVWFTVNITAHELFSRARYRNDLLTALTRFDYLRSDRFRVLPFDTEDEYRARNLLEKYDDQVLSFHDALCAAVMLRTGIYKVFSFDKDFWILGFEVMPGRVY